MEGGATSPMRPQPINGIGEAINQYESNNSDLNQSGHSLLPKSASREPTAITRVKKALGTPNLITFQQQVSSRPTSMGYLEKVHDKYSYLDVTQHTVAFPPSTPREIYTTLSKSIQGDENYVVNGQVRNILTFVNPMRWQRVFF